MSPGDPPAAVPASEHPGLAARCLAVSVGGALGALVRWSWVVDPADGAFPWSTFAINVLGSALLAAVAGLAVVQRSTWLPAFLGPGLLGGFTTMSAASVETLALIRYDAPLTAASYALGTLGAAVLAVVIVDRWTSPADRAAFVQREGEE